MNMKNLLKIAWLIACLAVLVWTFAACGHEVDATLRAECLLLAEIIMLLLTLPSGILWWLLLSGAGYALSLIGIEMGGVSATTEFVVWFGFVVVGYLQWFVLTPWLWRKWMAR